MNRDDIIRMALEVEFEILDGDVWVSDGFITQELERFAALVAAHTLANIDPSTFMSYREGFEAGAAAEREACAKVCADGIKAHHYPMLSEVAAAIRARGETK
jgi:hypothetical protein